MFMKKIFIEIITVVVFISTLPVVIGDNNCTICGDNNCTTCGDNNFTICGDNNYAICGDNNCAICDNNCTIYGDPPRQPTCSVDGLTSVVDLCVNLVDILCNNLSIPLLQALLYKGRLMNFTDNSGVNRSACLISQNLTENLPLLVWLHPSLVPRDSIIATGLLQTMATADLTNDITRRGYYILIISGRSTTHFYPSLDSVGLGWDNWYRNYDRSDRQINADALTIDYFINETKSKIKVDGKRIYMSGWSNGAAMAVEYALNTRCIAAAAVFSAPDPYRDVNDPCPVMPNPPYLTPFQILYNQCDILGICTTGKAFIDDLKKRYPNLTAKFNVTNAAQLRLINPPICINDTYLCSNISLNSFNHIRWPVKLNEVFFNFLKNYVSACIS